MPKDTPNEHATILVDSAPTDLPAGAWPSLEGLGWESMSLGMEWANHDSSHVDAILASLEVFGGDKCAREGNERGSSPRHHPRSASPFSHAYPFSYNNPESGLFEKHDSSISSHQYRGLWLGSGDDETNTSLSNLLIAQLSQLSMRLSSLRNSSATLARAAENSTYQVRDGLSLIHI